MFSSLPRPSRSTAAWRISAWTTLAFAFGTALAFGTLYALVNRGIRQRSDTWLKGEIGTLSEVSATTPKDRLYSRVVEEAAELATREVPGVDGARGKGLNSVFFLQTSPDGQAPLWVGPRANGPFLAALQEAHLHPGVPKSIEVKGSASAFRVVVRKRAAGGAIYLGLSDLDALRLLHRLTLRFIWIWAGMVVFGFLISYLGLRRTLLRVEGITKTVARIGIGDLKTRVSEGSSSDEISRLAQTFNRMLDRVQASVSQLRAVTDAVAHDLKTPVTSVRGRLEAALSDDKGGRWREHIAESIEELDKLSRLLNTTLDLAEAEGGALPLRREAVDLSAIVRQLADLYHPAMVEGQHELSVDLAPQVIVSGDLSLLSRMVGNLLDNEIAHLPAGCHIQIGLRLQNGAAELLVQDNGPGFPPEVVNHAFERYVKGMGSSGHGLGLAFVNAVAQAHGGSATIANSLDGGALIRLILPAGVRQAT